MHFIHIFKYFINQLGVLIVLLPTDNSVTFIIGTRNKNLTMNKHLDFWIFFYSGHIPDFRCKFLGDDDSYTNTNTKLNNSRNVTFQFNQCDVTVTTNLSGTVVKEIVPCRAEYEFSGQQTVASEVSGDSRFKSGVRL